SFKMAARKGMIIMLGISPIILIAAFIEGFLTRHTQIADGYRFAFILVCFLFMVLYFVVYPRVLIKRNIRAAKIFEFEPIPIPKDPFKKVQILSIGQLYNHTIGLIFRNIGFVFGRAAIVIFAIVALVVFGPKGLFTYYESGLSDYFRTDDLFNFSGYPATFVLTNGFFTLYLTWVAVRFYKRLLTQKATFKIYGYAAIGSFIISASCSLLFSLESVFGAIVGILALPFLSIIFFNGLLEGSHFLHGAKRTILYMNKSWGKYFLVFLLVGLTALGFAYLLSFLTSRTLFSMGILKEFFAMILTNDGKQLAMLYYLLSALTQMGFFLTFAAMVFSSTAVMHFTGKETSTACHLFKQLSIFNSNK
ncbi:MAG: hypothetical protein KDC92_08140, partial [Bacteroidetes bacterium]|nr:hypothetical protein [Bacteroidota bacterium]